MIPVKTDRSNFVFVGPTVDIGDLHAEVEPAGVVYVDWVVTDAELAAIANGAIVRLGIWSFPMPPVSLEVRPDIRIVSADPPVRREVVP